MLRDKGLRTSDQAKKIRAASAVSGCILPYSVMLNPSIATRKAVLSGALYMGGYLTDYSITKEGETKPVSGGQSCQVHDGGDKTLY